MHLADRRPLVSVLAALATAAVAVSLASPPASATPQRRTGGAVVDGHARFQVLSPTFVRLEYAADEKFQDGTTFNAVDRHLPPTAYRTDVEDGWRIIETTKLTLRYKEGSGPFTPDNTSVTLQVNGRQVVAHPRWQNRPCVFGQVCEAEQAALSGGAGVANDHRGYTGTGFVAGYQNVGATTTFQLDGVPQDGRYALHVRYANDPANSADGGACVPRTLSVNANGEDVTTATFDPTGSWDDWAVDDTSVELKQGTDAITLARDTDDCGNVNVDSVAVTEAGEPMPQPPPPPPPSHNLGGWFRGLDGRSGPVDLHDGLLSTDGWYLLDDSRTPLWKPGGWVKARPSHDGAYQDGYFFGYGHDYRTALRELAELTGPAPLLPKWAFGFWYSRYFPYTTDDYEKTLIPAFREHKVPLDVLVVDTDWKHPSTWNGWNWNPDLFPDPKAFLDWTKRQGLHTTLNIHSSIQDDDPRFAEANATAGGLIDHGGGNYVWDWGKAAHAQSYFDLHQPFEKQGVDFWWLDWCCDDSRVSTPGITPDTWINHLYAKDLTDKGRRGFAFSRMGSSLQNGGGVYPQGPWAAHRYDLHFTGDTLPTWDMLNFETYFTIREGNIGLPYVTHDIGSFIGGHDSDDMYARWVQLGTFQPVDRVHSDHGDRLPWKYGPAAEASAEKSIRLREALVPYSYTTAREAHDTGLPMVRGLYLDYPDTPEAYSFDHEYMYGDQMLVAPIASPGDVASTKVWFPPGDWVDYFTGARYHGPSTQTIAEPLGRMPVYVKAGGIVPEQPAMTHVGAEPDAPTVLRVYSGADGTYRLYDDAGEGLGYRHGEYAWTPMTHTQRGDGGQALRIGAAQGAYPGQPATRRFQAQFVDTSRPAQVLAGGTPLRTVAHGSDATGWWYDADQHVVHANLPRTRTDRAVQVALEGSHVVSPPQQPVVGVDLQAPDLGVGQQGTVKATVTNHGPGAANGVAATLDTPSGWTVRPTTPVDLGDLGAGDTATATWQVTPPASADPLTTAKLTATASYGYGSPAQQADAENATTVYAQSPVQAPFKTSASTTPAYFGQAGDRLGIATDGVDVWTGVDDYGAVYQPGAAGQQSTAVVKVDSQDATDAWAKAGLMMRDDMTKAGASPGYAMVSVTPGNGVAFQWDGDGNGFLDGNVNTGSGTAKAPVWLKLARDGSTFTGSYSTDGTHWTKVGSATVPATQANEDAGVFMTSHSTGRVGEVDYSGFQVH